MTRVIFTLFLFCNFSFLYGQVSFGDPVNMNSGWKFHKGDSAEASAVDFDDSDWRDVDLPHDWSIEGPYSPHHASATGYLPGGVGWYRKKVEVPGDREKVYIYFEGIYRNGEVFVNGKSVGMRPNGYISHMYDITSYLNPGEENTLAVRVDHSKSIDSRWYTGSGIYRDVFLVYAGPVHISRWGVFYQTKMIGNRDAEVIIQTDVTNHLDEGKEVRVKQEILDQEGESVTSISETMQVYENGENKRVQQLEISNPRLWSLDDPYLYELKTSVFEGDEVIDETITPLGIRTLDFDPDNGFSLNGENMNVKGVCLHHDAGALGSAVPREVWKRRLLNLKSLGCNAIRTSHNPQAPDLYELCDEIGLLVLNEAFDEWEFPKKKWVDGWNVGEPAFQGPYEFFEEWGEQDLKDMILRDRNHPSVFMWSIGNEVDYPNDPYSHPVLDEESIQQQHTQGYQPDQPHADRLGGIAKRLASVVRENDPSRPVTAGLAGPVMSNKTEYPEALDVVGYNYTERRYEQDHEEYPDRILYGSENGHSYEAWKAVRDNDYIFGQFLWTGINYLGEAFRWPSRGFTSGLLDLGGFVKPRGYFRQSLWSDEPMIYAGALSLDEEERNSLIDAPSRWNFEEGDSVRVVSYTNCHSASLSLNGEKVGGKKTRDPETGVITWDMEFKPGTLRVTGFEDDQEVVSDVLETPSRPHRILVKRWQSGVINKGDVLQVEIQIVDREGRPVHLADNKVTCEIDGPAELLALEASNPADMSDYTNNTLRVYRGRMIAYVRAEEAGKGSVSFSSPWLESAKIDIEVE